MTLVDLRTCVLVRDRASVFSKKTLRRQYPLCNNVWVPAITTTAVRKGGSCSGSCLVYCMTRRVRGYYTRREQMLKTLKATRTRAVTSNIIQIMCSEI